MTPSPPLAHHDIAPTPPPTLAELVAKARHPKQPKTGQLEAHREELLRLRRAGDSVEVLAIALRGLGVDLSPEALRLWLNRELGQKPIRRRKVRSKPSTLAIPVAGAPAVGTAPSQPLTPTVSAVSAMAAGSLRRLSPENAPLERATSLIRAGETPLEAFSRRQRERETAAAAAKTAGAEALGPRIVRDDI